MHESTIALALGLPGTESGENCVPQMHSVPKGRIEGAVELPSDSCLYSRKESNNCTGTTREHESWKTEKVTLRLKNETQIASAKGNKGGSTRDGVDNKISQGQMRAVLQDETRAFCVPVEFGKLAVSAEMDDLAFA